MSDTPKYTAFRYMTRFQCIGPECESSCCTGGWKISIDREHYKKTRKAMGASPETRQEFDAKVVRADGPKRTDRNHALMVLQDNGSCGFFGADKLCSLQKRYGEGVLSDTCSLYPRAASLSGQRRELAGLASCPEVARQLLLHDDAMDLVEVSPDAFPRPIVHNNLSVHPDVPYVKYHDELRNLVIDLLSAQDFPLASRLFFVAYFGNRTQSFLYRGVSKLDEPRLLSEVERIHNADMLFELHQQFMQLVPDPQFPTRVVLAMLRSRSTIPDLRRLLATVLERYVGKEKRDLVMSGGQVESLGPELVSLYLREREKWQSWTPRIDRALTNLVKNYWVRDWYYTSPNLLMHSIQTTASIACVRFLLHGHPLLAEAEGASEEKTNELLERALVSTVQGFSRAFDHDAVFTKDFRERLNAANLMTLAHAACLARF